MDENASGEMTSARLDLRDVFYVLGLITLVVAMLYYARDILVPIVFALLIWFVINALATALQKLPVIGPRIPLWLALTLGAAVTLSVAYGVGRIVFSNVSDLSKGLSEFGPKADDAIFTLENWLGFSLGVNVSSLIENLRVQDLPLQEWLPTITETLTSTASNLLLVVLYAVFLLIDQPYYRAKIRALFPDRSRYDRASEVLSQIAHDTRLYIWIMTAVSVGVGLMTYATASYFQVEGAAFWGFLAFALNYIPTIGSILGVLFPSAFALVQLESFEQLGLFVLILGVVQITAGNLILPRVTGNQLNLSEFVVILSLSVFGALWGVAGLFLGVPIVMVIVIVLSQFDSTRPFAILLSKNGKVIRH